MKKSFSLKAFYFLFISFFLPPVLFSNSVIGVNAGFSDSIQKENRKANKYAAGAKVILLSGGGKVKDKLGNSFEGHGDCNAFKLGADGDTLAVGKNYEFLTPYLSTDKQVKKLMKRSLRNAKIDTTFLVVGLISLIVGILAFKALNFLLGLASFLLLVPCVLFYLLSDGISIRQLKKAVKISNEKNGHGAVWK